MFTGEKIYYRKLGQGLYQVERMFRIDIGIKPSKDIQTRFAKLYKSGVLVLLRSMKRPFNLCILKARLRLSRKACAF